MVPTIFDKALHRAIQVFDSFNKYNIKIIQKKVQAEEVLIFGGCILDSTSGELVILSAKNKIQAIVDMPLPETMKEEQVLLGMIHQFKN